MDPSSFGILGKKVTIQVLRYQKLNLIYKSQKKEVKVHVKTHQP